MNLLSTKSNLLALLFALIFTVNGFAQQNTFNLHIDANPAKDSTFLGFNVSINNTDVVFYERDTVIQIQTNYPDFDTLYYAPDTRIKEPIITRFQPHSDYKFIRSCCASIDIAILDKARQYETAWEIMKENQWEGDSMRGLLDDKTKVSFAVGRKNKQRPEIGMFAEWSGFPYAIYLDSISEKYEFLPRKGFYRSNNTTLLFGKIIDPAIVKKNDKNQLIFPESIESFSSVSYRFMHGEKLVATYENNSIVLKIK